MDSCYGMSNIHISKLVNLVALSIQRCYPMRPDGNSWKFPGPSTLEYSKVSLGTINNVPEFHKLHSLLLRDVTVDREFFTNFSSKFPHLKDLTLDHCIGCGSIQISSQSVECFQFYHRGELQSAEFDVQNIRKFVFDITCDQIPLLSFHTESKEWESKLELSCSVGYIESSWFVKLREFLKELSLSRISLKVNFEEWLLIWVKNLPCSSTPVVENLKIVNSDSSPVTHDLLCALFRCCRPTFINNLDLDCARVLYELFITNQNIVNHSKKCFNEKQSLLLYDLEEIDVEILCKEKELQSIPLIKYVEDVADRVTYGSSKIDEIRYRLKWGAFRCTS